MGDYSSAGGFGRTSVKLLTDLKNISARGGFVDTIENVIMVFSLTHSFNAFLQIEEIHTWWKAVEDSNWQPNTSETQTSIKRRRESYIFYATGKTYRISTIAE